MNFKLLNLSIKSKVCLLVAISIMAIFFIFKTLVVFKYIHHSSFTHYFEWVSVIAFMPPFFIAITEFVNKLAFKETTVNTQLKAINVSNLVVTLTIDGFLEDANENFLKIVGYTKKELVGKHHSKLCTEQYRLSKEYREFWDVLKKGEFVSGNFQRIDKNGNTVWLFGTYTPVQNDKGEYTKVLKIATDITAQHKAQELVNQKSAYLEHASKIIRHDMHSGINTYLPRGIKSLKRRLSGDTIKDLKIHAPLKLIEDGLHHAQKVYAGVYEFTNLVKTDQQMSKKAVNVKAILEDYLKLTAYKNQVLLDDNLPDSLEANEALFCTAVDNLIRNGLKYNDSKTKWVKIYLENNLICIEDNGRGMSQEDFELLSQPYIRKEGQKEQGTGLGLNICKEILSQHGFGIEVEKQKNGTKIKIKVYD